MRKTGVAACLLAGGVLMGAEIGKTEVAAFQGGRRGAFFLYYDDGCDSTYKNALPVLVKHKVPATFYLIPSAPWFRARQEQWVASIRKNSFLRVGNHTFRHTGADNAEIAEREIAQCDAWLRKTFALKKKELISYARPGGVTWALNGEADELLQRKYYCRQRPRVNPNIAGRELKTFSDAAPLLERALAGEAVGVMFHGVGGDWFNFPADEHEKLIAALAAKREEIWLTPAIQLQKYQDERAAARVESVFRDGVLHVELACAVDPELYDEPLTLVSCVPADWTAVSVVQGGRSVVIEAEDGRAVYDVVPVSGKIELRKNEK